jgi:hypothetical protein
VISEQAGTIVDAISNHTVWTGVRGVPRLPSWSMTAAAPGIVVSVLPQ